MSENFPDPTALAPAHCPCMARIQMVRTKYEVAVSPVNIDHEDFARQLGNELVETVCTTCGTKYYVGMLGDLTNILAKRERADADKLQALAEMFRDKYTEAMSAGTQAITEQAMLAHGLQVVTDERDKARDALKSIIEMAERSDAHPDVDVAAIAKAALDE